MLSAEAEFWYPAQGEFNNCFIIHFVTERKQNKQQLKTNKYSLN
jgi:hypothetical protein